jgi:transcriptional regulator with XRE-family HTH domain
VGYKARNRPRRLAEKIRQIRVSLGLSQSQLRNLLDVSVSSARMSEYEHGVREPPLIVLLAYGYLTGIHVDDLIDDSVDLPAQIKIKRRRKRVTLI